LSFDVEFDIAAFGDAVALALESVDGVLDVALDDVLGDVLGLVDDELDDGDVLGVDDDELDEVDGGVLGLIEELDDVEPLGVDGVVVVVDDDDVEGDGVTTGGVVEVVEVLVSR
jgi:hypothetical protein